MSFKNSNVDPALSRYLFDGAKQDCCEYCEMLSNKCMYIIKHFCVPIDALVKLFQNIPYFT
jgi:hypothetical protein